MPIKFDKENKIFYLNSKNNTYAVRLSNNGKVLRHLYWGKKVSSIKNFREISQSKSGFIDCYDADFGEELRSEITKLECACDGGCDLRTSAFSAIQDGFQMLVSPKVADWKIISGKPDIKGLPHTYAESDDEAETIIFKIEDISGIRINLFYTVYKEIDAITRHAEIENISKKPFLINRALSASVDFSDTDFELLNIAGSIQHESQVQRSKFGFGVHTTGSNRGASSHMHDSFTALVRPETTEQSGDCYAMQLIYSGNFISGVDYSSNSGLIRMFTGINPDRFEWLLEPGEKFITPEAVLIYSANGIGEMSRTFHKLYRTRLCRGEWRDKIRPILFNNWEGTYFDFTEDKILNIAKYAKEFGVELMVLDDGWFGKRDIDTCSLGDWVEHKTKLPNGIDGLAKKVTDSGLKFGLWFEPECVNPDSDLNRLHPDWHIGIPNRTTSMFRNQWILDLSNPEVQEYLIEAVSNILNKANITYVKWDYNRNMSELGSAYLPKERMGELSHRYILGLYHILDELNNRFPYVLFEGCSGGGGRYDAGMLYYMPQTWASDCSDAAERLKIQYGTSLTYPSITMGSHVSAVPNHQVGRTTPLKMRGDVAMFGQFGYELDPDKLSDEEKTEIKEQVKFYKEIREYIQFGDMYRISSPFDGKPTAWNFVSNDKGTVVVGIYNVLGKPLGRTDTFRLCGLDPDAEYKDVKSGEVFGGDELMNVGFFRSFNRDFYSEIRVFKKV